MTKLRKFPDIWVVFKAALNSIFGHWKPWESMGRGVLRDTMRMSVVALYREGGVLGFYVKVKL